MTSDNTAAYFTLKNEDERSPILKNEHKGIQEEKSNSLWGDTTTRQKFLIAFVSASKFSVFMCLGIPTPFLSRAVLTRDGEPEESSILMQATMLSMAISSGVFGKYQISLGNKKLLLTGLLCFSLCQAGFGMLEFTSDIVIFFTVGAAIRILQGLGQGAYAVASLTGVCSQFDSHVGTVFGISEAFASLGSLCGPVFGSLLLTLSSHFCIPFAVSSAIFLPLLIIGYYLLRHNQVQSVYIESSNLTDRLSHPGSVFFLGCAVNIYGVIGIVDVLLSVFMRKDGFTLSDVAIALLIARLAQCITSTAIGWISAVGDNTRRLFFCLGIFGLVMSPFILSSVRSKLSIYIFMALFGAFCACALINGFVELLRISVKYEGTEFDAYFIKNSELSGVWNLASGLGGFVFPLVGSVLFRLMPFPHLISALLLCGILVVITITGMVAVWNYWRA